MQLGQPFSFQYSILGTTNDAVLHLKNAAEVNHAGSRTKDSILIKFSFGGKNSREKTLTRVNRKFPGQPFMFLTSM